jgi:cobalamin biosynthesis protein CobW
MIPNSKLPVTIITGFLGAGKTTLVRHVLEHAAGRRLAVIVNEFGAVGIDGETLRSCGIPDCENEDIVELANGCLCCTLAEDFLPTMQKLIDRPHPPEHILVETSGLALPKPLLKAFAWPPIRSRLTVDGVIAVVDGPAVAEGRFADDPAAVARQRAEDQSVEHDNPLSEVYEDQLLAADLILLNKTDLLDSAAVERLRAEITAAVPRAVKLVPVQEGRLDPAVLLGLGAAAEDDLVARPSHHDAEGGEHEHDDFESFVVELPEIDDSERLLARLRAVSEEHDILRIKGFVAVRDKKLRLEVQGVGGRFSQHFDRPWPDAARAGHLVVIGQTGLDRAAIAATILGTDQPAEA